MKKRIDSFWIWGGGLAALVVAAGAAVYFYQREPAVEDAPVAAAGTPAPTESAARPVPIVPPTTQRALPLPALDASDAEVQGGITELAGQDAVTQFLTPQRIVRNLVVTIDNATREKMAFNQRPLKPTAGKFVTAGADDSLVIAPANYSRYTPFVTVVDKMDSGTLVGMYRGLQPLFQQAYEELGNPNKLFNARLLEVIEHLLETPDVTGPVRLVQPSVYFRFADPQLEALSSGQKLLIRMGPENAGIVKAKLRQIQADLS